MIKDDGDLVEIRKMEKQLRLKTYQVKREQLLKVFNTPKSEPENHYKNIKSTIGTKTDEKVDESKLKNKNEQEGEPKEGIFYRPKRQAVLKSQIKTHKMAHDKVISIIHKPKKSNREREEVSYVEHVFTKTSPSPDPAPQGQLQQHIDAPHQDLQAINQAVGDYGTDTSEITNEPDSDHNEAFMEPPENNSSNSPSSSSDNLPLQWDNSPVLVNLIDPAITHSLFSQDSDQDEVFERNTPESPQPDIRNEDINLSPISPYRRVTRSVLRSGTFSLFSDSSTPDSLFERQNPLRRPFIKVVFSNSANRIEDRRNAHA